jgi:hypothetical protein
VTYGRPPSHARCVEAIAEIRRRMAQLAAAAVHDPTHLETDLLQVQLDYWDGWRRILEDQRP